VETLQTGVGLPKLLAGPYLKVSVATGVANGSALGAALVRCTGASFVGRVGSGAGLTVSSEAIPGLATLLKLSETRIAYTREIESMVTFLTVTVVRPDVPVCRG
jgi:hypothetical protein